MAKSAVALQVSNNLYVSMKNALEELDLAATFIQYLLLFLYNPEF